MEIEPDCVISSDSFEKYGVNERCRVSKERVQGFLDRGLMSQANIYQRLTEDLSERLNSVRRYDQPAVIDDIRQSFRRLRDDPSSAHLSETRFKHLMEERLPDFKVYASPSTSALLLKILRSHALYPFSAPGGDSKQPHISEDSFLRAVCLLTLNPFRRHGNEALRAVHRCYTGKWGPHSGWYLATRGKESSDFRRRLFRSLAVSSGSSIDTNPVTKIPVPRYIWFESEKERPDSESELGQQFVVAEDESELSIDILDVLSECPPETDRLTADPFRESYQIVLPSLPKRTDDLSTLSVPSAELVTLLELIQRVHEGHTSDAATAIKELGSEEDISWQRFNSVMAKHSVFIADGLSKIFSVFSSV